MYLSLGIPLMLSAVARLVLAAPGQVAACGGTTAEVFLCPSFPNMGNSLCNYWVSLVMPLSPYFFTAFYLLRLLLLTS